jgi:hypothetical protein
MVQGTQNRTTSKLMLLAMVGVLLFAACNLSGGPAAQPNAGEPDQPEPTQEPTQEVPEAPPAPIVLDVSGVASGFSVEVVPAASGDDVPPWDQLPEYRIISLDGYLIGDHFHQPKIYIYPVAGLHEANEFAGQRADDLQALLAAPQDQPGLPFLPPFNAAQVLHFHLQFMDFASGQGLRFLTQFSQAYVTINNDELFYTFQGLTADGRYYVAAVLPVSHPDLPADGAITGNEPPEFESDYELYLENIVNAMNPQPSGSFFPDLTLLDAMMASLQINE